MPKRVEDFCITPLSQVDKRKLSVQYAVLVDRQNLSAYFQKFTIVNDRSLPRLTPRSHQPNHIEICLKIATFAAIAKQVTH